MYILFILLMTLTSHLSAIEVQGHRGARGTHPENTMPAFMAAIEAGADALEMDLLLTEDEEVVIYHDYFINPELVTYLDGKAVSSPPLIATLSLAQVKQFDCGRKTNPSFPHQRAIRGTKIPTLHELITQIKSSSHPNAKKIRLNLEIKREPLHPEYTPSPTLIVKKILECVSKENFADRVSYSSFDPEILFELRKSAPHVKIAYLKEDDLNAVFETASALKAETVSPEHILIDAKYVNMLHKAGYRVVLWTANSPALWDELINMGVEGIITDYPADLIAYLKKKGLR